MKWLHTYLESWNWWKFKILLRSDVVVLFVTKKEVVLLLPGVKGGNRTSRKVMVVVVPPPTTVMEMSLCVRVTIAKKQEKLKKLCTLWKAKIRPRFFSVRLNSAKLIIFFSEIFEILVNWQLLHDWFKTSPSCAGFADTSTHDLVYLMFCSCNYIFKQ